MSQETVGILALIALLLPTGGAIVARLIGKKFGDRATQVIGGASFVVALGSVALLSEAEVDRVALGPMAIFVPASGPLIDSEAFTLRRREENVAEVEQEVMPLPVEGAVEPPEAAQIQPLETDTPTLTATPTAEATTAPIAEAIPEPSPLPTDEPIPTPTVEPSPEPTSEPTAEPTAPAVSEPVTDAQTYTVDVGDTLRGIAERFDVSVEALMEANDLSSEEADALPIGLTLAIPSSTPPASAPAEPASPPRTEVEAYIVEPGDTLRSIAAQFDISAARLQEFNGLSAAEADSLTIGQKLFIPVQ